MFNIIRPGLQRSLIRLHSGCRGSLRSPMENVLSKRFVHLSHNGFGSENAKIPCMISQAHWSGKIGWEVGSLRGLRQFSSSPTRATKAEKSESGQEKDSETSSKSSFSEIMQMLKLAKPETKLMGLAMLFLCVSSTVSMLFPSIIGKVIDMTKDDSTDCIKIFNREIPLVNFYVCITITFMVGALANFGRVVTLRRVGERLMARIRLRTLKKLFYQDATFWDKQKSGDLISRLINDSTVVTRSLTQNVSDGLRAGISGLVGISMMFFISSKLTAYMCLMFPPLIFLSLVFGRRIKALSKLIQQQLGSLTRVSEEQFGFVKTIQTFNNEAHEVGKFKTEVKKLYDLSIKEGQLNGYFYGGTGFVGNIAIIALLSMGTYMVKAGELSVGDLSSFMMYTIYSGSSVFSLSNFYTELMKGVGASSRVFELTNITPLINPVTGKKINDIDGDIVFKDIHFKYPTRPHHTVFSNLNLKIKRGEHVCLVGPSGCGKSTISQLLLRFYDPLEGEILLNGHNLKDMSLSYYRRQVGIVQQEPTLFSGTILENLTYGKKDATQEEVIKACQLASCQEFIEQFADKYQTVVGSKGASLSGGQKQRVALARTLITNPKILILDEATSALDTRSEKAIQKTLIQRQQKGQTTISIAHRLSTIRMSDRIVVFNHKGEIVEQGAFKEMYADPQSELNKLLSKNEGKDSTEEELDEIEEAKKSGN
ncbi:unnamed protein product [Kuraishia capsulata CBS 1993]|uniref:ABC transporter domain-containing protein n=1 Tax=Kuraishia capsulata CBS 1993 TaxID=1382522 RepID=W6MG68_9ASCO|nr:uncharacterized protein KUCA_T00000421001 [Kuraishia capsulata CBS 1993]CDK24458.1 unnamed protein product [Kuraishia capsulata CBS 1993]